MSCILIKNANVVNEGKIFTADVLIKNGLIDSVKENIHTDIKDCRVMDASGKYLFPGVIDDQVHFREPGLTHKGDITSESKAAVAGGITSFMEMPNTAPATLTQELLEEKYKIGSESSVANFSFYMGASNDNIDEVLKTDPQNVCGVKVFMGSSTGNMLVDKSEVLEKIFSQANMLVAVHCEDEETIKANQAEYKNKYGDDIPVEFHPVIRNAEACYKSSSLAVELAKKHNTRLHVLHISTEKEIELFKSSKPLKEKKITAEACVHHLWFSNEDYKTKGKLIKWNPAIKTSNDRDAVLRAVNENIIDVIATDHAPHTWEEKQNPYTSCPSGGPLVQHSLVAMLELYHQNKITLEKIVEKMCHAVADCFNVSKRGYIKEGFFADLVLVDLKSPWTASKETNLYKCGWSPFDGQTFQSRITHTFVNGNAVYEHGSIDDSVKGMRLKFER